MTLETLLTTLSEQNAALFSKALTTLSDYESDPVILKSELAELRTYGLNRSFEAVWKAMVTDPYYTRGKWESRSEQERELIRALNCPEVHTTAGYVKRAKAATKADGAVRSTMLEVLDILAPIAARAEALKSKIGKRAPKETKTSIERAERAAKAMTCQICGQPILAETGKIAHHGYERPGTGWQTASCEGARKAPFEVSRDALAKHLILERARLVETRVQLDHVESEVCKIVWTFEDRSSCTNVWHEGKLTMRVVTRDTFEAVKTETAGLRKGRNDRLTFDDLKQGRMAELRGQISRLILYIKRQQQRHDLWAGPTFRRQGDIWVPLAAKD